MLQHFSNVEPTFLIKKLNHHFLIRVAPTFLTKMLHPTFFKMVAPTFHRMFINIFPKCFNNFWKKNFFLRFFSSGVPVESLVVHDRGWSARQGLGGHRRHKGGWMGQGWGCAIDVRGRGGRSGWTAGELVGVARGRPRVSHVSCGVNLSAAPATDRW
jgi:hypothetical protein